MIPLVILDVDGTLVGTSGQVEPCVWDAVERAREAGVRMAVCTGRPGTGIAARIARRLDPDTPHIFQNGAQVTYVDGETLFVSALKEMACKSLIQRAREENAVLEMYTPDGLYVERRTDISEAHAKMIGVTAIVTDLTELLQTEPIVRAQWVVPLERAQEFAGIQVDGTSTSMATSPALPGTAFLSITRTGVDKGSAVRWLIERLELDRSHVMAVGDSVGDGPMLAEVGFPRVMANGHAEMLASYPDGVLPSVEACGVVEALDDAIRTRPTAPAKQT